MTTDTICPKCGLPSPLDTRMAYWHCPHCGTKRELVHDPANTTTYEYKVVYVGNWPSESKLNDLGEQGWRMVCITQPGDAVFMREVKS